MAGFEISRALLVIPKMMDCCGAGKARKFAEICAATVLAGELSLIGAITAGE